LPFETAAKLRELMARLGLTYGAIDLRLTPEGRYVFLEINPAGQFLYIEQATGQPIAAALAQTLLRKRAVEARRFTSSPLKKDLAKRVESRSTSKPHS
jgi:D-alanine-D-alanine ligase-like ATP-grasp enzyme